jgi:hypothetical protein
MLGLDRVVLSTPEPIFTNKFHLSSLHTCQTSRDIRSESRATRTPCHPIAPTSSSRRLRERESPKPIPTCHFPNVITFQLSSAPRPFSSGTDQRVSETPCDRIESTPLEGVSVLRVACSIVAANCCGLGKIFAIQAGRMEWSGLKK